MPQDIQQLLASSGLVPSERKVYLASLSLGPSSAQNIVRKAGISRTAVYEAFESLGKKGLMTEMTRGKKTLYVAEDPGRLVSFLQAEQQRLNTTMQDVMGSLDAFRLLAGGSRPTVRVYEGDDALVAFFDHISQVRPDEYAEITNSDDVYRVLDAKKLISVRENSWFNRIPRRRSLTYSAAKNPPKGSEIRRLPSDWNSFHANIAVYGKCMSFAIFGEKLIVVIMENETLANAYKKIFDALWDAAEVTV